MPAGGFWDKLGNRYEAKWLVYQYINVLMQTDQSEWLRFEGITPEYNGFEFAVGTPVTTHWHQTKINNSKGNWTISALAKENVLNAFKVRLLANERDYCYFISQDPAKDMRALSLTAKTANNFSEFEDDLSQANILNFDKLTREWELSKEISYLLLKRCHFMTISEDIIESYIKTYSKLLFINSENIFPNIRDILEKNFNKKITTENARELIKNEAVLQFKEWLLGSTLSERLITETKNYLSTYQPFGILNNILPRNETAKLLTEINSDNRSIIFITGIAGSGKSGVIRETIFNLEQLNIPCLAIRIDQLLDCTSPQKIGETVLNRNESPVITLKGLFPSQTSILIIDQIDAVSEVSGRDGKVKDTVLQLVEEAINVKTVKVVLVCRSFDLENDKRLKILKDKKEVPNISVPLLNWKNTVEPYLINQQCQTNLLSPAQQQLLCSPLNLSIFMQLVQKKPIHFISRNDLFSQLIELKSRAIRTGRTLTWEITKPLSVLANWMSEQQKLNAPEDVLNKYSGAVDLLSSEGLIIRSKGYISFFHESFFDYMYARGFILQTSSIAELLLSTEQHLFRRTQVRQILEALRQSNDKKRYLTELSEILHNQNIRFHIKVAVSQWLSSLTDTWGEEVDIILSLHAEINEKENFSLLMRYCLLSSVACFDELYQRGWLQNVLNNNNQQKINVLLWRFSTIIEQRPFEIIQLLDKWWADDREKNTRLLEWFCGIRLNSFPDELFDFYLRVLRKNANEIFVTEKKDKLFSLFHMWSNIYNSPKLSLFIKEYFRLWYATHPQQHPFSAQEWHHLDNYALGEIVKNEPAIFLEGTVNAFNQAIDLIIEKQLHSQRDSSFSFLMYSEREKGTQQFLDLFRSALQSLVQHNSEGAKLILNEINPNKHLVFTHLWLETIAKNGKELCSNFISILDNPDILEAGYHDAKWFSFANAVKAVIPFLNNSEILLVEQKILSYQTEIQHAIYIAKEKHYGELAGKAIVDYLNNSGRNILYILDSIGEAQLTYSTKQYFYQLKRKFPLVITPNPKEIKFHWVQSPISLDKSMKMTDLQWLKAFNRYDKNHRLYSEEYILGGAEQLASELYQCTKNNPVRFFLFLQEIPYETNEAYISSLLRGIADAEHMDFDLLSQLIIYVHNKWEYLYHNEIFGLFNRYPELARQEILFDILINNINQVKAEKIELTEDNLMSVDKVMDSNGTFYFDFGNQKEQVYQLMANLIKNIPEKNEAFKNIIERDLRENKESIHLKCCIIKTAIPLFNLEQLYCANLVDKLSLPTNKKSEKILNRYSSWFLIFLSSNFSIVRKLTSHLANFIGAIFRNKIKFEEEYWEAPLITYDATLLIPYLLYWQPKIGDNLLFRLLYSNNKQVNQMGIWHLFRLSFQEKKYIPLANIFIKKGAYNRKIMTNIALDAIDNNEFRDRAESIISSGFYDQDNDVQHQASRVFFFITPENEHKYKELISNFIESPALSKNNWSFFHFLENTNSQVDEIIVSAIEKLLKSNDPSKGFLRDIPDLLQKVYYTSERDPILRKRILDLIDNLLFIESWSIEQLFKFHDR